MSSVKKKRVSKKKKIAWRKHVDIKDVEEFLEDKRLEERLGDRFDVLPDRDLFQVDTRPEDKTRLSNKQRKRLALQIPPKCFSLLQPLTKTPDPLVKRNRVRTKEERTHPIARRKEQERLRQGIVKAKERVRTLNREHERKRKLASKRSLGQIDGDVWQIEDVDDVVTNGVEDKQWLTADTVRHMCAGLGKLRKAAPRSLRRRPNAVAAIQAPHPGTSYNPALGDHQQLLADVAQDEVKRIRQEKHLERVTTRMFSRTTLQQKETNWLSEMSEGLSQGDQKENRDGAQETGEYTALNPPAKNVKKDRKQRRKQIEQKRLEKARLDAKIEKKKLSDMYRLRRFEEQITRGESASVARSKKRTENRKLRREQEPRQLSRHKVQPVQSEFQLPEEMSGSLRGLRALGNPLRERYHSLQRRSVLAASVPQLTRPRAKLKRYERASHKMGWEAKGY